MLYYFSQQPTLMFLMSLLTPFYIWLMYGEELIDTLKSMKAGQPIREAKKGVNAPAHQAKVGTPTMGGILIVALILGCTLVFGDLSSPTIHCCMLVFALTATLGMIDDYAKITKKSSDGVNGWFKIALQAIAATAVGFYSYFYIPQASVLVVPFYGVLDLGFLYIPLAIVAIIGTSNAVNLTDGLDGLASGCMMIAAIAFLAISNNFAEQQLLITVFSACMGFIWFNCNPARVFMGDTGSLSLGGLLGTYAVCTGNALVLVIIGAVFVAEALSVMLQVAYFKYSRRKYGEGRRLFLMAPLHHHYEKKGWKETQVCVRFWIIAFFCALIGAIGTISALDTQLVSY